MGEGSASVALVVPWRKLLMQRGSFWCS